VQTGLVSVQNLLPAGSAAAFDNAIPDVKKYSKFRSAGREPKDLGLKVRELNDFGDESSGPVLKGCGYAANCFSTTADPQDTMITTYIKPWQLPSGLSTKDGITQLQELIRSYPPGQNGVDGGGFQLVKTTDDYLYAQFESLKKGRVDDVEFAIGSNGLVQVRSASRLEGSKIDFGANAKRLNYLSEKLRDKGWGAAKITKETHLYYYRMNSGKSKVQCVGVNCKEEDDLVESE